MSMIVAIAYTVLSVLWLVVGICLFFRHPRELSTVEGLVCLAISIISYIIDMITYEIALVDTGRSPHTRDYLLKAHMR